MNWKLLIIALTVLGAVACLEVSPQTLCSTDSDCFEGYACDAADSRSCLRACEPSADAQCLSSETCVATTADGDTGVCKPATQDRDDAS